MPHENLGSADEYCQTHNTKSGGLGESSILLYAAPYLIAIIGLVYAIESLRTKNTSGSLYGLLVATLQIPLVLGLSRYLDRKKPVAETI